jgi:ankyrin repeat protein
VNAKHNEGWTALFSASMEGNSEILSMLLEGGADVNVKAYDVNAKGDDGTTALMFATWKGHSEIVLKLLEKGAEVDAKHNDGTTALMAASKEGHSSLSSKPLIKVSFPSLGIKSANKPDAVQAETSSQQGYKESPP